MVEIFESINIPENYYTALDEILANAPDQPLSKKADDPIDESNHLAQVNENQSASVSYSCTENSYISQKKSLTRASR